jgi:hypothetical protein
MPDNNILNDEDSARYQVSLFWHNRQVWFNLVVLAGTAIAAAIILVLSLYIPVPAPDVFFLPALLADIGQYWIRLFPPHRLPPE